MNNKSKLMKRFLASALLLIFMCTAVIAQDSRVIDNTDYGIKFTIPSGWKERKVEETSQKDAISYSFEKDDGSVAMMLLAFKVNEVKNLDDLVYTLEKDLTLNIPKRDGEYKDFDKGDFDGMSAMYKDTEFTEMIYYYRTKHTETANFAYMLRFIAASPAFNSAISEEVSKIGDSFEPVSGQ